MYRSFDRGDGDEEMLWDQVVGGRCHAPYRPPEGGKASLFNPLRGFFVRFVDLTHLLCL